MHFFALQDPSGRHIQTDVRSNRNGTFTCEFVTNLVGEHSIEVTIREERLNVTSRFYTYDASKIKMKGQQPQAGFIGAPVEFDSKEFASQHF